MAKNFVSFKDIAARAFSKGAPKEKTISIQEDAVSLPVKIRTTPVMWGVPCDELGFSKFWINFFKQANVMPWDAFAASEGTYLPKARNMIHKAFVEKSDLPYLVMIDSDVLIPPSFLETLMAHNLPVVGGYYHDKHAQNHHPCVYDFIEEKEGVNYYKHRETKGIGLEQVDAMGAGCWLMNRETAIALGSEPYDMNSGGEDMKLCKKLKELGIPLTVDWDMALAHSGVFFV